MQVLIPRKKDWCFDMGYFYFSGCKLKVPVTGLLAKRIRSDSPHTSFLPSHLRDVSLELSCLKHLASKIGKVNSYLDVMAGSGFSAKLMDKVLSPQVVWLNDFSLDCFNCLQHNFKKAKITRKDANQIALRNRWDLVFVDFNTFTLKHIHEWEGLLNGLRNKFRDLWFVDTASFASLFGQKSFEKAYGVLTLEEYYVALRKALQPYQIHIRRVACFKNKRAAVVHAKFNKQRNFNLDYIEDDVNVEMKFQKGFDLV
jgi:hypothetical protein